MVRTTPVDACHSSDTAAAIEPQAQGSDASRKYQQFPPGNRHTYNIYLLQYHTIKSHKNKDSN